MVFANSTALHPATWNLEFWEKSPNGTIVWDSGILSPTVSGGPAGNPGYVDVPIYGYSLAVNSLAHNFTAGDSLQVEVTVNIGSTVPLTLWYDSSTYPSGMTLPSSGYATPLSVVTQDVNGTARTTFYTFWSQSQRQVVILVPVSDSFGGYDINKVIVQVTGPGGMILVNNISMTRVSGNSFSYQSTYRFVFPYQSNSSLGVYEILVSVVDNNGAHQYSVYGYYSPYI